VKPTIRCSELDQFLACPGSLKIKSIVKPRQGDDGAEGTLIHALIAGKLFHELGASCFDFTFDPPPAMPRRYAHEWLVNFCFQEVKTIAPPEWPLAAEVALAYEFERFNLSGHIDCLALSPDATEAIGWDWKAVYVAVDSADMNEQVLGYIVLLKRAYPCLKKVTFYIVQPRVSEEDGFERVSQVTVEFGADVDEVIFAFAQRINAALDRADELNAGRKQCRFCVGCSCPELQRLQHELLMKLTPQMIARLKAEPDDALLGDFVVNAKILAQPTEDAEEMVKARLESTGFLDAGCGTRITRKVTKGAYKVLDSVSFYRELRTLIPADDKRASVLSYSVTRIKDGIAEVMDIPKTGKASITAEGVFDAKLRPYVEQGTKTQLLFT